MAYLKPAEHEDIEGHSVTPEQFADVLRQWIIDRIRIDKKHRPKAYFQRKSLDIQVSNDMKRVSVFLINASEESYLLQMDFDDSINTIYVNHKGEIVDYFRRILSILLFLDCVTAAVELGEEGFVSELEFFLLENALFELKGKLSAAGQDSIIQGRAIYDDEFSLSFTLYTQIAAKEMHKEFQKLAPNSKALADSSSANIDEMSGLEFEAFCAAVLRANGFSDVEVTRGSGDQGIDILATKEFVKYGFQCKCYSSDVGNKAVQEALAGKAFYGCHVAVVLTNRHFTTAARALAEQVGVVLWDRELLFSLAERAGFLQDVQYANTVVEETLSADLYEHLNLVKQSIDALRELVQNTNHLGDDGMLFGNEDARLVNAFDIELLQYMVWVMEASMYASEIDAQITNNLLDEQFNSEVLETLMGDEEFLPLDFEHEEPAVIFALARVILMNGKEEPGNLIIPVFRQIGELLASADELWSQERLERTERYCSILRLNISLCTV